MDQDYTSKYMDRRSGRSPARARRRPRKSLGADAVPTKGADPAPFFISGQHPPHEAIDIMRKFLARFLPATLVAFVVQMVAAAPLYADPPARVARISFVTGDASIRHGTSSEWMAFLVNYPVTTGDELWTDAGARAELHIGSTALRLSDRTALRVVLLEDDRIVLSLTQGEIALRVRSLAGSDHMQVETPTGTIAVMQPGDYRIVVDSLGMTMSVAVRSGDAQVSTASGVYDVLASHVGLVSSDPNAAFEMRVLSVEPADEFDAWAQSRSRAEDASESGRYVSMEMTGYEALDGNGRWEDTPEFGPVWVPFGVAANWAPYTVGRWVWVDPWGWTWIDEEPWGFAPFHYGRWAYYRNAWVWCPGVRVARPVYAPALVVFVGGSSWHASGRFGAAGGVAWFPLAPGEPFIPSYHVSPAYQRSVNVTYVHVTNINVTNVHVQNIQYRNAQVAGAVTAVPRETFVSAKPVRTTEVALRERDLAHAVTVADAAPVAPRPQSRAPALAAHPAAEPPAHVETRVAETRSRPPVVPAHTAPPPANMNGPKTAVRVPIDPRPQADAVAKQRAVMSRQVLEHAQLQDKHQQERATLPPGKMSASMQQRQAAETQKMEARHASENKQPPRQ